MERGNENEDCVKLYGEKKKINQCFFMQRNIIKRDFTYTFYVYKMISLKWKTNKGEKNTPKKTKQTKEKKPWKKENKRKKRKPLTQNKGLLNLKQTYTNNSKP